MVLHGGFDPQNTTNPTVTTRQTVTWTCGVTPPQQTTFSGMMAIATTIRSPTTANQRRALRHHQHQHQHQLHRPHQHPCHSQLGTFPGIKTLSSRRDSRRPHQEAPLWERLLPMDFGSQVVVQGKARWYSSAEAK